MDGRLKIGFVLDDSLDKPDGVQQYVLTLGEWLQSQGHDVHYLVGQTARTDLPNTHSLGRNVNVRFNQNRMSIPLPVSRQHIRRLLAEHTFDILHVQVPYSPMLGARVIAAASAQTAVVGTFHIAPHSRLVHVANQLLRLIVRRSLRRFDQMISVSEVARSFAYDTFGIESAVVPNTLHLQPFYEAKPFAQYRGKVPTIVFLGRLVERKGCQQLLSALVRLRQLAAAQRFKVVVCGTGPLEASLKEYAQSNGLTGMVDFVGFVTEADKPRYLTSADIAVFPSTGGESFGIVLLEAMAASPGVVLAGNNPGYASVIGERPDALFDPKDEIQFAQKLRTYLADAKARALAHEWQLGYVRKYDVPTVGQEILAAYSQALRKRRG